MDPNAQPLTALWMPAAERARLVAESLIGIRQRPAGSWDAFLLAEEAEAYYRCQPYPLWHFGDWKTQERGPLPRCMPFLRAAINRSAKWLFRRSPQISVPANAKLEQWLRTAWDANQMHRRLLAAARRAGYQGGLCLKFSYDATAQQLGESPLAIQVLSTVDHVQLYYDPHVANRLLMARIQYPFYDPHQDQTYLFREEWTAEQHVRYRPLLARQGRYKTAAGGYGSCWISAGDNHFADLSGDWQEDSREANVFGVIPIQPILNLAAEDHWGIGDFWGLHRVMDRINLTYHLMDRSNQLDSEPNLFLLDVESDSHDFERAREPGESIVLKSSVDPSTEEPRRGQVVQVEARGAMRPAMMDYARDLRRQVLDGASNVELDPEEFTNKGNLTQAVLSQLYGPLLELTHEKRMTYGTEGIEPFLELVVRGLRNANLLPREAGDVRIEDPESYDVQLGWAPLIQLTEDEKQALVDRYTSATQAGFMSRERGIQAVAAMEEIHDVPALKEEILADEQRKQKSEEGRGDPGNGEPGAGGGDGGTGAGGTGAGGTGAGGDAGS